MKGEGKEEESGKEGKRDRWMGEGDRVAKAEDNPDKLSNKMMAHVMRFY